MAKTAVESGCKLWTDCFTCPYPDCISGVEERTELQLRRAEAIKLSKGGLNEEEIAKKLGRSKRQVIRYLAVGGIKI